MNHTLGEREYDPVMNDEVRRTLANAAERFPTPSYVYLVDAMLDQFDRVANAFDRRFILSYAVKSNPNDHLLRAFTAKANLLDCSSIAEVERGLIAGYTPERLTFSGPAKRIEELRRAVEVNVGEMVCECVEEAIHLDTLAAAANKTVPIAIRINPNRIPAHFGVNMAGKPTQFGIDEDDVDAAIEQISQLRHVNLEGFHIYSGTNCLNSEAIAENYGIFANLFARFSEVADIRPKRLIFGSGLGIPYSTAQQPIKVEDVAELANPIIDKMKENDRLSGAQCVLELGRHLVSSFGYLLTRVVRRKRSRDTEIALCDAGFNNHLSACGMMGQIIRRNWNIRKVSDPVTGPEQDYMLTGPLCTTIDQIANKIALPELRVGDVLAIPQSGAYGPTASPNGFISHPMPREIMVRNVDAQTTMTDITPVSYDTVGPRGD